MNVKQLSKLLDALELVASNGTGLTEDLEWPQYDDFKGLTVQEIAKLMGRVRNLHEALESVKSTVGRFYDDIRVRHLPSRMDEEDTSSFKVAGLGTVSLTDDLRVKVLDSAAEFEWLEEIGCGNLITETVNSSSLKALLRRRLVAGEEVPGSIFDVAPFTRASITKR